MSNINNYIITDDQDKSGTRLVIDEIVKNLFSAFTNKGKIKINLDIIRRIFIQQGIIIKNIGDTSEIYTIDEFIQPREELLNSGSLLDFEEEELTAQTIITGNIAQRISVYHKKGTLSGKEFYTKGVKNIQFIKTADGWKINSLTWDDERDGLKISG